MATDGESQALGFAPAPAAARSAVVSAWQPVAQPVKHSGMSLRKQAEAGGARGVVGGAGGQSHVDPSGHNHSGCDQKWS